MAQQTKKVRHVQKHDVETNWLKATGFTPLVGEIIVYDKDEKHDFVRTKIGDGETNINDLPFVKNAIIDVVSLPTENINQEAIYRVLDTVAYDYGDPLYDPKINYVDTLPEEGENVVDLETEEISFYYNISDGLVYCYVNEELSAAAGADGMDLPVGWYPYDTFVTLMGGLGTMILNVYALPEQGMPAMDLDTGNSWVYYHIGENEVYCYINETLSQFINNQFGMTVPTGWYPYSQLSSFADVNYQGIFTKEEDIPNEGFSILVNNILYTYNDNWYQVGRAQIQTDWDQWDDTQPDYIKNKPIIATPDWNVTSGPGVILNKPFGEVYAGTVIYDGPVKCNSSYQGKYVITGYYQYSPPKFLEGVQYKIALDESYGWIGTTENGQVPLDDGHSYFESDYFTLISDIDLVGLHYLRIQVNQNGSYRINSKYLPEGAKIGKQGGYAQGAEVFNDYQNNEASGNYSHAEGGYTRATGNYSHAEGQNTRASEYGSHAEGGNTKASGINSHAEGENTAASGSNSHAEGSYTTASGSNSHAEGYYTTASGSNSHVQGKYNIEDTINKYAHIVGNGSRGKTSNAYTLDWNGNAWFQGNVYVGGTGQDDGERLAKISEVGGKDNVTYIPQTLTATQQSTARKNINAQEQEIYSTTLNIGNSIYLKNGTGKEIKLKGKTVYKNLCSISLENITQYKQITIEPLLPGIYTFSCLAETDNPNETCVVRFLATNGSVIDVRSFTANSQTRKSFTFKTLATIDKIELYAGPSYLEAAGYSATYSDMQIEASHIATGYEPYQSSQTGIGGHIVLNNTSFTADCILFDGDELNFTTGIITKSDGSTTSAKITSTTKLENFVTSDFVVYANGQVTINYAYTPALLYNPQNLTDKQKTVVRKNLEIAGRKTIENGEVFGYGCSATASYSHAEGYYSNASGIGSHTEGYNCTAEGKYSHAEGQEAKALGEMAHAEGMRTTAQGKYSHTEGLLSTASGEYAHAEGTETTASKKAAHAEGGGTKATQEYAHSEGYKTIASGFYSHAEGFGTKATANQSHSEGIGTIASGSSQHVQGKYNIESTSLAHIVGNGESEEKPSNAHTLDWDGNAWYAGSVQGTDFIITNEDGTTTSIGDLNAALEAIIAMQEELMKPPVSLINFTIGEQQYNAEAGMTWGQWVESSYSGGEWHLAEGHDNNNNPVQYVVDKDNWYAYDPSIGPIYAHQEIKANYAYTLD